jgi:hypothetical protein
LSKIAQNLETSLAIICGGTKMLVSASMFSGLRVQGLPSRG